MSELLVSGCAGFIGWKVCELLVRTGHKVLGIDNLNDAYDTRLKEWRLHQLQGSPNFRFRRVDIAERGGLTSLWKDVNFHAVINLAARAGVRQSLIDPATYFETNVTGTLNLLEIGRESGIKKFVLASSSSLYGSKNLRPFREDMNTDDPLSPYAASKKAAEVLCYSFHSSYQIDVTVLRFFTVYGPAGRPDMSLFRFVQWISEGLPVTVYGDGQQSRDFTYVEDIAKGTVAALKPMGYEVINLGADQPIVLNEAIELIECLVGRKAMIDRKPFHPADVMATWADIQKARQLLEWQPMTRFEEGLQRTVGWYREHRGWAKDIRT